MNTQREQLYQNYVTEDINMAKGIVSDYCMATYPSITGRKHDALSTAKLLLFTGKILDFMVTTEITFSKMGQLLAFAARTRDRDSDPTIYLVTSPQVLGGSYLRQGYSCFEMIGGTEYDPTIA